MARGRTHPLKCDCRNARRSGIRKRAEALSGATGADFLVQKKSFAGCTGKLSPERKLSSLERRALVGLGTASLAFRPEQPVAGHHWADPSASRDKSCIYSIWRQCYYGARRDVKKPAWRREERQHLADLAGRTQLPEVTADALREWVREYGRLLERLDAIVSEGQSN